MLVSIQIATTMRTKRIKLKYLTGQQKSGKALPVCFPFLSLSAKSGKNKSWNVASWRQNAFWPNEGLLCALFQLSFLCPVSLGKAICKQALHWYACLLFNVYCISIRQEVLAPGYATHSFSKMAPICGTFASWQQLQAGHKNTPRNRPQNVHTTFKGFKDVCVCVSVSNYVRVYDLSKSTWAYHNFHAKWVQVEAAKLPTANCQLPAALPFTASGLCASATPIAWRLYSHVCAIKNAACGCRPKLVLLLLKDLTCLSALLCSSDIQNKWGEEEEREGENRMRRGME